jgi:hypothetical protein
VSCNIDGVSRMNRTVSESSYQVSGESLAIDYAQQWLTDVLVMFESFWCSQLLDIIHRRIIFVIFEGESILGKLCMKQPGLETIYATPDANLWIYGKFTSDWIVYITAECMVWWWWWWWYFENPSSVKHSLHTSPMHHLNSFTLFCIVIIINFNSICANKLWRLIIFYL